MMNGKLNDNDLEQVNGGIIEVKSELSLISAIGSLQKAIKALWGSDYKKNPYYSQIDQTVGLLQARIANKGDRQEPFNRLSGLVSESGVLSDPEVSSIWDVICANINRF